MGLNSRAAALNQTPRAQALLQLRRALDASPGVQSQFALSRSLNQRLPAPPTVTAPVVQRLITYDAKSDTWGKNAKRPGWFGWLKTLYADLGGDIAHIESFQAIQDTIYYSCVTGNTGFLQEMVDRIGEDDALDDLVEVVGDTSASGQTRLESANKLLASLNSSSRNTRKGGSASINRRIKQYIDPEVSLLSSGKYQLSDQSKDLLAYMQENDVDLSDVTTEEARKLKRTPSEEHLHTSDFNQPVPIKALTPRSRRRVLAHEFDTMDWPK
jgi:hypothetical protein